MINQSIDHLKKKLALISINEEVIAKTDEDDWQVDCDISTDEIVKVINSLKEKYWLVLTLYLLEIYDHAEIAEVLKITATTSRTHLLRGEKMLKAELKNTKYAARY